MLARILVLATAVAEPAAQPRTETPASSSRDPATPERTSRIVEILVSTQVPTFVILRPELELRAPAIAWSSSADPVATTAREGLRAYLEVRPSPDGTPRFELELVVEDGRAWVRHVDATDVVPSRAIASSLAHLLAGIATSDVAPDRNDAPMPAPLRRSATPPPKPVAPTTSSARAPTAGTARPQAALGVRLELALAPLAIVGVAAPQASQRFAGGTEVSFVVRWPRGALFGVGMRGLGTGAASFALGRIRIAVGGGYEVRVRRFALPMLVRLGVEPWWVRRAGAREPVRDADGRVTAPGPLFGISLGLAPGVVLERRDVQWRIAAAVELGASAVLDDGLVVPSLAPIDDPEPPRLRAGGLELGIGALVGASFRRGSRAPNRSVRGPSAQ